MKEEIHAEEILFKSVLSLKSSEIETDVNECSLFDVQDSEASENDDADKAIRKLIGTEVPKSAVEYIINK